LLAKLDQTVAHSIQKIDVDGWPIRRPGRPRRTR
jgi:hypothetical protein